MFSVAGNYKKCLRSPKFVRPATLFCVCLCFVSQVSKKTRTCDSKGGDLRHLGQFALSGRETVCFAKENAKQPGFCIEPEIGGYIKQDFVKCIYQIIGSRRPTQGVWGIRPPVYRRY